MIEENNFELFRQAVRHFLASGSYIIGYAIGLLLAHLKSTSNLVRGL